VLATRDFISSCFCKDNRFELKLSLPLSVFQTEGPHIYIELVTVNSAKITTKDESRSMTVSNMLSVLSLCLKLYMTIRSRR
jgi:hypothetical protein